ncbi:basic salivary proline-rich protein 2-like [Vulpes lagopus]|uniref:basic salivary proline-rich protein 2-like n=1 Tax=Vulpes lagopus TaxID=494514 RepID=UPI001BCA2D2F|nr:basic salivary proline-rich protein 2-like [Vulpes lagopus]
MASGAGTVPGDEHVPSGGFIPWLEDSCRRRLCLQATAVRDEAAPGATARRARPRSSICGWQVSPGGSANTLVPSREAAPGPGSPRATEPGKAGPPGGRFRGLPGLPCAPAPGAATNACAVLGGRVLSRGPRPAEGGPWGSCPRGRGQGGGPAPQLPPGAQLPAPPRGPPALSRASVRQPAGWLVPGPRPWAVSRAVTHGSPTTVRTFLRLQRVGGPQAGERLRGPGRPLPCSRGRCATRQVTRRRRGRSPRGRPGAPTAGGSSPFGGVLSPDSLSSGPLWSLPEFHGGEPRGEPQGQGAPCWRRREPQARAAEKRGWEPHGPAWPPRSTGAPVRSGGPRPGAKAGSPPCAPPPVTVPASALPPPAGHPGGVKAQGRAPAGQHLAPRTAAPPNSGGGPPPPCRKGLPRGPQAPALLPRGPRLGVGLRGRRDSEPPQLLPSCGPGRGPQGHTGEGGADSEGAQRGLSGEATSSRKISRTALFRQSSPPGSRLPGLATGLWARGVKVTEPGEGLRLESRSGGWRRLGGAAPLHPGEQVPGSHRDDGGTSRVKRPEGPQGPSPRHPPQPPPPAAQPGLLALAHPQSLVPSNSGGYSLSPTNHPLYQAPG